CSAPDCHWKFKRHEHLKRHIATTHAKKRPFHCPVDGCMKSFSRSDNFSRHGRVHTMERPFSCTFPGCLKTFSRSDNLNQH
ncbi:hypothetical protein CONCODRAFT_21714, partial [Conidiobolus coronatus NRRL 28638]